MVLTYSVFVFVFFFLMIRRPPRSTRTDTLFPYTTLFRSFRVLQGAVSGPMIPGSQALLLSLFPPAKKGVALAIWSMTTLVAPICGPILGGYISDNYSWPWIFFINIPVGLFCAFVCWQGLKTRETPMRSEEHTSELQSLMRISY